MEKPVSLKGMVAVVTGASSGIGEAIVQSFAEEGASVVLASRNRGELQRIVRDLPDPSKALVLPTDVGSDADVQRMVEQTIRTFGRIDILVNSAGFGIFKPLVDISVDEFDTILRVNLRGTFLCLKYVLPHMYEQQHGTVVTISSVAGKHGFAGGAAYCSSKFGVMGLNESAFHEARSNNVRIVTISPGSVDTPFFDTAGTTSPNRERILQSEDVAATVLLAVTLPERAMLRELDIRPTNPRG